MRPLNLLLALCSALWLLSFSGEAEAQNLIKRPRAHSSYTTELEPHLVFGGFGDLFAGPGVRATWPIADPAFIPKLNNSVGIGVGADLFLDRHDCETRNGRRRCHDTAIAIPVAMQWNFWFTKNWSAFGEPGLLLGLRPFNRIDPHIAVGGRYQFNDAIALTLRLGVPYASFGVSFLL